MERINFLRKAGKNIYYFSDLNDAELEFCYQRSRALIFASVVEGFGLPLVEAMHFGKPVLASNIPVFREVGTDYPFYFDLKDPATLVDAITEFESGNASASFVPRKWLTWEESIHELFSKITLMAEEINAKRSGTFA
jgi:alpha-1,2-rhamnosyltransferase